MAEHRIVVPGVVGSSPITHPRESRGSGLPRSPICSILGRRQVVRQGTLTPSPAGSNPAVPARITTLSQRFVNMYDPVAQSAEQLPFKQWVRGSNPRRVTNSSQATYRLRRVFYVSHKKLISRSFCCSSFSIRNHCVGLRIESGAFFVPSGDENPGGARLPPQRRFGAQPPHSGGT